jgi:hypothetical protein
LNHSDFRRFQNAQTLDLGLARSDALHTQPQDWIAATGGEVERCAVLAG